MKLVHYSHKPVEKMLEGHNDRRSYFKPHGLWVSDDDDEMNWRTWCIDNDFGLSRLTHVHDVELADGARILTLATEKDVRRFNTVWKLPPRLKGGMSAVDWHGVQQDYDGIIITPYLYRLRYEPKLLWYSGWDCASGCIWRPRAIALIRLREVVPEPEPRDYDKGENQ